MTTPKHPADRPAPLSVSAWIEVMPGTHCRTVGAFMLFVKAHLAVDYCERFVMIDRAKAEPCRLSSSADRFLIGRVHANMPWVDTSNADRGTQGPGRSTRIPWPTVIDRAKRVCEDEARSAGIAVPIDQP